MTVKECYAFRIIASFLTEICKTDSFSQRLFDF